MLAVLVAPGPLFGSALCTPSLALSVLQELSVQPALRALPLLPSPALEIAPGISLSSDRICSWEPLLILHDGPVSTYDDDDVHFTVQKTEAQSGQRVLRLPSSAGGAGSGSLTLEFLL